ncbi:MAG: Beta-phosphoglucomutase [uncultured bacterium]|nr:MAG: Beta-phosphoglucomutase [uncultured bacterium]
MQSQVIIFDFFGVVFDPHTGAVTAGLEDFLLKLQAAGKKCGVASSSSTLHIEQFLTEHNIASYFGVVVGADTVTRLKPDPECYQAVADYFTAAPETCLIIDDSEAALTAAARRGFQIIYFGNGLDNFKKIATLVGL